MQGSIFLFYLILFQCMKRLHLLSFSGKNNNISSNSQICDYLPKVEIKDYNLISNGRNFFDQPVKIERTYKDLKENKN